MNHFTRMYERKKGTKPLQYTSDDSSIFILNIYDMFIWKHDAAKVAIETHNGNMVFDQMKAEYNETTKGYEDLPNHIDHDLPFAAYTEQYNLPDTDPSCQTVMNLQSLYCFLRVGVSYPFPLSRTKRSILSYIEIRKDARKIQCMDETTSTKARRGGLICSIRLYHWLTFILGYKNSEITHKEELLLLLPFMFKVIEYHNFDAFVWLKVKSPLLPDDIICIIIYLYDKLK